MRYSKDKASLPKNAPEFDFQGISEDVKTRFIRQRRFLIARKGPTSTNLFSPKFYSIDGGLVASKDAFDRHAPDFFKRSRRTLHIGEQVHLRGTRYTISSNPTFELRQKLQNFREDLDEALVAIQSSRHAFFQLGLADYVKNSIITMFNSFLQDEKLGRYRFEQVNYQAVRREGQVYAQAAVDLYFGVLLQERQISANGFRTLVDKRRTFDKLQDHILDEYERGVFSSRHITRREVSHPVTIAVASTLFARFGHPRFDAIVGLPSGSTELAFAHTTAQRVFKRRVSEVLFVPVSLHSSKDEFDAHGLRGSDLTRWAKQHSKSLERKNLLVVDDNSSTGQTVQFVVDALQALRPRSLDIAVAEADIVRSEIDLHNPARKMVASRSLYKHSVGVLAVSKKLNPKIDLNELYERRKMLACVRKRYIEDNQNLPRQIIGKVYADLIKTRTEDVLKALCNEDIVRRFRKTFLSNFYAARVSIESFEYESVEHAYQAMKFEPGAWTKVTESDVDAINRKLRPRGASITREELPKLFVNPDISAGTSKIAANYLRILGHVRPDWDDVKVVIMTELLVQKYADKDLYDLLVATRGKYLIEGNDWNDTFWGECDGRGRNVLGRMLMTIRDFEHAVLAQASERIRARTGRVSIDAK